MSSRIAIEKTIAIALTGWLVTALAWQDVIKVFVVLGQGHFLTAYFYQYRAGKLGPKKALVYLLCAGMLTLFYIYGLSYAQLVVLATIYFLFHMLWDELHLLALPMALRQSSMHFGRFLEMLPIIVLYSWRVTEAMYWSKTWPTGPAEQPGVASVLLFVCFIPYLALVKRGYRPDYKSAYFACWGGVLLAATYQGALFSIPAPKLTGFIIIYHYFCWYSHYFLNLPDNKQRGRFSGHILLINAVVLGAYGLWGNSGPGRWMFKEDAFYIWTLLHLLTSTRLQDLKSNFKLP